MPPSSVGINLICLVSFRLEWDQKRCKSLPIWGETRVLKEQEEPAQFVYAQHWWTGTNLQREEDKRAARGSAAFTLTDFTFLCQTDEASVKNLQRCSQNTFFNLYFKILCAFEHSVNNALFWNAASMSEKKAKFFLCCIRGNMRYEVTLIHMNLPYGKPFRIIQD